MTNNKKKHTNRELFRMDDTKKNLKERPNERLTCCACKNQTFLLVFGCSDFPFFDLFCSKCGSLYNRIGK